MSPRPRRPIASQNSRCARTVAAGRSHHRGGVGGVPVGAGQDPATVAVPRGGSGGAADRAAPALPADKDPSLARRGLPERADGLMASFDERPNGKWRARWREYPAAPVGAPLPPEDRRRAVPRGGAAPVDVRRLHVSGGRSDHARPVRRGVVGPASASVAGGHVRSVRAGATAAHPADARPVACRPPSSGARRGVGGRPSAGAAVVRSRGADRSGSKKPRQRTSLYGRREDRRPM